MKKILKFKRIIIVSLGVILFIVTIFFFKSYTNFKYKMEEIESDKAYVMSIEKEIDETYSLPVNKNNFDLLNSIKYREYRCKTENVTRLQYLKCLDIFYKENLDAMVAINSNLLYSTKDVMEEFKQNGTYIENGKENPHQIFLRKLLPIIKNWYESIEPICKVEIEKYREEEVEIAKVLCEMDRIEQMTNKMLEMRSRYVSSFIDYNASNTPITDNYKKLLEYEKEFRKW